MPRVPAVVLCAILSYCALAQTPDTATIRGRVTDPSGGAIAHALITATNELTGIKRTAETGDAGNFSLAGLPVAGTYEVVASQDPFSPERRSGITLWGGTTLDLTFLLILRGAGRTEVTVTGIGDVRTDQPQLGIDLDSKQIEETPLLNRRITYLPLLNAANRPAINQGDVFMNQDLFTTNGAGRRQAWFEVDGVTGNDSWGRQTIFSNIPLDAVQEMTMLENAFSAEYGGSTGSVVNIVTKSGGNQFHGDVLELWRPAATEAALAGFSTANAASGNDVTSDTLGQSALALSGPTGIGGLTHIFAAGEYSREDRASPIISPVAPGSFVGHYRGWLGFLRARSPARRSQ